MPDDVLRLRATVVSEEALANIRAIGREIGAVPARAGKGVEQVNSSFSSLGKTIKGVGSELKSAVPSLGAFGLGAAGVGVAARTLIGTLGDISSKIVQMKYASKELGLSEQALRAFTSEAQKAGIAPEAMMAGLSGFRGTFTDFKNRIGDLRGELYAMGAGDLVNRIAASTDMLDGLKQAFDFKEALNKSDPSGEKGRRLFDMLKLGAVAARLSWEQWADTVKTKKAFSDEDIATAVKFNGMLVDMGETWDLLKVKFGVRLIPALTNELGELNKLIDGLSKLDDWASKASGKGDQASSLSSWMLGLALPGRAFSLEYMMKNPLLGGGAGGTPAESAPAPPLPSVQEKRAARRARGFSPISFGGFGDDGGESSGASRIVQTGVYDALVEFSGGSRGSVGGGSGFTNASYSPGGMGGPGGMDNTPIGRAFRAGGTGGPPGTGTGAGAGTGPAGPPGTTTGNPNGQGVGGGSQGGTGGITAPAGTAIAKQGLATVTSPSGKKFQVDERFAQNFQGFINDYEKAGGTLGSATGTLGSRPHNASGHPIGAAIDINQVGYGVRGGTGKSLPVGTENELAEKWGLVSGANWRKPDTGHFGIRSVEAARQALIQQGVDPGRATAIAQAGGGGTKGTWFNAGAPIGSWSDPAGRREGAQASRLPHTDPGIATPGRGGLGEWHEVTLPDGRVMVMKKSDVGPGRAAQKRGVGVDINAAAAAQLYPGGPGTFPSGAGGFHVRRIGKNLPPGMQPGLQGSSRIDNANRPPSVNGNVNVTVNSNGTKANAKVNEAGDLYQGTTVRQHKQMQRTEDAAETLSI